MKTYDRKNGFLGVHFDFHASRDNRHIGKSFTEKTVQDVIDMLHPDYIQCDTKGAYGIASYPTRLENRAPEIDKDILKIWRKVTKENGVGLFAHHAAMDDRDAAERHPDWALMRADGSLDPRLLNIPGEQEMIGRGISFCAVCDAAFYRNKHVIIVGAGNAAFEESLYLAEFASKVTILARRDVISAEQITQEKVAANPKIEVLTWRVPQEVIIENNRVAGLKVLNKQTGAIETMLAKGVFPYIGADPVTDFCRDLGITNEKGYLVVNSDMSTAVRGVYGAGDVCDKVLRQVVTATNDGAIAAQSALAYLR